MHVLGGQALAQELPLHSLGRESGSIMRVLLLLSEAFFSPHVQPGNMKPSGISQWQCKALHRLSFLVALVGFYAGMGESIWLRGLSLAQTGFLQSLMFAKSRQDPPQS